MAVRRDRAHRRLGVAVMVDVRVVEHDLSAASQLAAVVGLALEETVDHAPLKVLRTGPVWQVESGIADGPVDPSMSRASFMTPWPMR
jgi:hypothetical protein